MCKYCNSNYEPIRKFGKEYPKDFDHPEVKEFHRILVDISENVEPGQEYDLCCYTTLGKFQYLSSSYADYNTREESTNWCYEYRDIMDLLITYEGIDLVEEKLLHQAEVGLNVRACMYGIYGNSIKILFVTVDRKELLLKDK